MVTSEGLQEEQVQEDLGNERVWESQDPVNQKSGSAHDKVHQDMLHLIPTARRKKSAAKKAEFAAKEDGDGNDGERVMAAPEESRQDGLDRELQRALSKQDAVSKKAVATVERESFAKQLDERFAEEEEQDLAEALAAITESEERAQHDEIAGGRENGHQSAAVHSGAGVGLSVGLGDPADEQQFKSKNRRHRKRGAVSPGLTPPPVLPPDVLAENSNASRTASNSVGNEVPRPANFRPGEWMCSCGVHNFTPKSSICLDFLRGRCAYTHCKYSHSSEPAKCVKCGAAYDAKGAEAPQGIRGLKAGDWKFACGHHKFARSCKDFQRGYCNRGSSCKYAHGTEDNGNEPPMCAKCEVNMSMVGVGTSSNQQDIQPRIAARP
jgi:hypothetical protein